LNAGETCDDNQLPANGDGCSDMCLEEVGWWCSGMPSNCVPLLPNCGNNAQDGAETCDDGGTVALDGCNPICQIEPGFQCNGYSSICLGVCGDGLKVQGEICDDGNHLDVYGCI
jgi:cysteine-rich repeat protein